MACYDFDYAILLLRQAVDFAEIEHDFVPLRKWVNEVERSGHEGKAIEARQNAPASQEFLLMTLQLVASGSLSPEKALWCINSGQTQEADTKPIRQLLLA